MRLFTCRLLFIFCALAFSAAVRARTSAARTESVRIAGERYLPLKKWADAKGFQFDWDQSNKTVTLTARWCKLGFIVNSKKATINGITVWLTSPVAVSGGTVHVAERDFSKVISPVLYPGRLPANRRIRTVVIAAGHGGKDPGYQINREQEKKYTLLMAKALQEALRSAGFRVIMTRESDVFVDLPDQALRANRVRADLFIALHYNAAAETEAKGVETFCLTPAGAISTNGGTPNRGAAGNREDTMNALLAYHVHKSLLQNAGLEDRGIRRAAFWVLRDITMPGVLIEGGFLSNPEDAKKILSANHRRVMARAIVDGILSFKRLVERR